MSNRPGFVARILDAVVASLAPAAAVRREEARTTMMRRQATRELRAKYEAARRDRAQQAQRVGSADHHLAHDLADLRDKSRVLVRDDAHAAAAVGVKVDNVVGSGIGVQASVQAAEAGLTESQALEFNQAAEAHWRDWCTNHADARGRDDFAQLLRTVYRTELVDGEALINEVSVDQRIALELVDADRVNGSYQDGRRHIRNGVELDANGRPVALWVHPVHPDDWAQNPALIDNEPKRVALKVGHDLGLVHVFERARAGQTRGVPMITPALPLFEHLHHYLDSEIIAARVNSNLAMFVRRPVDPATDPNIVDEVVGNADGTGPSQRFLEFSEPGQIEYLNEGEEIQSFGHNRPGTTFEPFVMRLLRAIAAACNLPYELILKDFGGMNYSSARVALLEARRGFDADRLRLVRQFVRPTYATVTLDALQAGRLPFAAEAARQPQAFVRARFISAPYGLVDPTKEIQAARDAIAANLSTPDQEAARAGMDAVEILQARARHLVAAIELEVANKLPPGSLTGFPQPTTPAAPAATPNEDPEQ